MRFFNKIVRFFRFGVLSAQARQIQTLTDPSPEIIRLYGGSSSVWHLRDKVKAQLYSKLAKIEPEAFVNFSNDEIGLLKPFMSNMQVLHFVRAGRIEYLDLYIERQLTGVG